MDQGVAAPAGVEKWEEGGHEVDCQAGPRRQKRERGQKQESGPEGRCWKDLGVVAE